MKCIIIDDEPIARRGMKRLVTNHPDLELLASLDNADSALRFIADNDVDLVFLDIQMPGMTGLELARALPQKAFVIFTTAYSEYAVESYEVDALDYLLKPISTKRFNSAVAKAVEMQKMLEHSAEEADVARPAQDCIIVKADRRFYRIPYIDITYVEGMRDYVVIHLADRKIITRMTIKAMEEILPAETFMRISKSYIINLKAVDSFDNNDVFIGKAELAIGQNYREAVLNRLFMI